MLDLAVVLIAVAGLSVGVPVILISYSCERRNRTVLYLRTSALSLLFGPLFSVIFFSFFEWAKHQAVLALQFSFCQNNHWLCALVDVVLCNASWIAWVGGGGLTYLLLFAVVLVRPNLVSQQGKAQ